MARAAYPIQLSKLVEEADFKLKRSDEYRASAASLLAECGRRIDAGDPEAQGVSWAEYCRVRLSNRSPSDLRKLMLSRAEVSQTDEGPTAVESQRAFDRAWTAFLALDRARQREFLRCGAALLGRFKETDSGTAPGPANLVNQLA